MSYSHEQRKKNIKRGNARPGKKANSVLLPPQHSPLTARGK